MKKLVVALVSIVAIIMLSSAFVLAEGMTAGVKGGLNLANLSGDDIDNTELKMGLGLGGYLSYDIMENFGVEVDALYSMKGAKIKDTDYKVALNYLEFPVLAKGIMPIGETAKVCAYAGPSLGLLLSAEVSNGDSLDIKDDTKSMDFGLVFGGGADFILDQIVISLDVRYNLGLLSVDDDDSGDEEDIKNSAISILGGVGFMF